MWVLSCGTTIKLWLRRTLVRSVLYSTDENTFSKTLLLLMQ